jgi:subtilisin family serine protease
MRKWVIALIPAVLLVSAALALERLALGALPQGEEGAVTVVPGAASESGFGTTAGPEWQAWEPGEVLVKFTPSFKAGLDSAVADGAGIAGWLTVNLPALAELTVREATPVCPAAAGLWSTYLLRLPEDTDILRLCRALAGDRERVVYAEPNMIARLEWVPDDPYYSSSGSWGQAYADMWGAHAVNLEAAWDQSQGAGVLVAVIDTGIDYRHPDWFRDLNSNGQLDPGEQYNIWVNPGEDLDSNGIIDPGEVNGIDDDGNGFIDDFYGWDFGQSDSDPVDPHGHGTHCAGIIAAVGGNSLGIVGVAPQARVMAVKAFRDNGTATAAMLVSGIQYAVNNGAQILSNSWTIGFNQTIIDAINYARSHGCVVVAAAGDSGRNAGVWLPARVPGVITAAALDPALHRASFSNYGSVVTVAAPGVDILSLRAAGTDPYGGGSHLVPPYDPNAQYYRMDGTSAACPFAAGVAALLRAASPGLSDTHIRRILAASAGPMAETERYIGTGLLDATAALAAVGTVSAVGATFSNPPNDMEVITTQGDLAIRGSAEGVSYVLEYGEGYYPSTWTLIGTGGTVHDGLLGTLVFTDEHGPCRMRLTVNDGSLTGIEHMPFYAEPDLHLGWPVNLGGEAFVMSGYVLASTYTSTPFDADGDGAEEIFIGSAGHTFGLRGDGTFLPGWPTQQMSYVSYATNGCMPGPSVADLEGDGDFEILWTLRDWYSSPGVNVCWSFNGKNLDGSNLPNFPQHAPDMEWNSGAFKMPFVLGDLNGDGPLEAVAAHTLGNNSNYYRLSAFDYQGTKLFTRDVLPATPTSNQGFFGLAFGDLDGNGQSEVVALSQVTYQNSDLYLWAFDADGYAQPGYPVFLYRITGTMTLEGMPFLVDLDEDGDLEVVLGVSGSQGWIHCYHHDGQPCAGFPIQVGDSEQLFNFCLGDVTGDGRPELIVATNYRPVSGLYHLFVIDIPTGQTLPGWPMDVWYAERASPAIVDVDNDGVQDVCFAGGYDLYAVSGDGQVLPGFPKYMSYLSRSGVSVGDVDGDNRYELITTTIAGTSYVWDLPTLATRRADWKMRGIDARNTSVWVKPVGPLLPGDLNCDGVVGFKDINPFVLALSDPVAYQAAFPNCNILNGDINGDGQVNFRDINPFVALLTGT